jgi:hypothetical protein
MIAWVQKQSIAIRLCFAFAYCGVVYALLYLLGAHAVTAVSLVLLTVFPLAYGSAVQLVLDPALRVSLAKVLGWGMIPVGVLCAGLLIAQFETLICIVILLPIFTILMLLGQVGMRALLRRALVQAHSGTLHVSLLMLPLLAVPVVAQFDFPKADVRVVTRMVIAAPADVVCANTYEIAEIQPRERVWTASHNILHTPLPIDAVVTGTVRQLRWTDGVRFQEHITDVVKNERLSWDFVFEDMDALKAFDPHVSPQGGIVNIQSGSYNLDTMPNGDTVLTLETQYSLTTPVNGYLSLWGEVFLQDFHHSVLSVIRIRSEAMK